jgi:formylglycine-generating enzyme required for sulfatase activity
MEFCRRLSQRLGRTFSLPSEAQWEYACRAGSTTPFAFGETLSPELSNYDSTVSYANGPIGEKRGETTPVGRFPANAWGLHDMHGNVWEWCLDRWHANYEGAPFDGGAWLSNEAQEPEVKRLLRGGSWYLYPWDCRSAYRDWNHPDSRSGNCGFRVCCLPEVNYVSRQSGRQLIDKAPRDGRICLIGGYLSTSADLMLVLLEDTLTPSLNTGHGLGLMKVKKPGAK